MLAQSNAQHFTMVPLADINGTTANKNISLSDALSKYDFLAVVIHRGSNTIEYRTLPIQLFTRNTMDNWEFYASTSGTTRDVYLRYVNDTTIYYNGTAVSQNQRIEFFGMLGGGA